MDKKKNYCGVENFMNFEDFIGQNNIVYTLKNKLAKDKIGHAVLFSGPKGQGKKTLASLFSKAILCLDKKPGEADFCGKCLSCNKIDKFIHPDLYYIGPQGKSIKIEQIRELKKELNFRPTEGRKKILIFDVVELMSIEAANSMLNILEEPPEYVLSVLLTTNPSLLLPTILSRCEIYKFSPVPPVEMYEFFSKKNDYTESEINRAIAFSGGYLYKARSYLEGDAYKTEESYLVDLFHNLTGDGSIKHLFEAAEELAAKEDEELEVFFEIFTLYLRDLFVSLITDKENFIAGFENIRPFTGYFTPEKIELIMSKIEKTRRYLSSNVNRSLAFEGMLLEIKEVMANE